MFVLIVKAIGYMKTRVMSNFDLNDFAMRSSGVDFDFWNGREWGDGGGLVGDVKISLGLSA